MSDRFSEYEQQKEIIVDAFKNDLKKEHFENSNKSSLEKINDHFEKNSTLEPNGTLRVKGWAEINRKLNEGKPFFGDILEFALTHDHLPTNAEIAKMPKQGQTPPLERRNFNSKENFMSDEFEEEERKLSPKELATLSAARERKTIADAVKKGTLACLPGADGYADTKPAFNIMNPDRYYHGSNLLLVKDFQQKNGFPTGEFITYQQIENAQKDIPELFIRKGQKGISLHVNEKDESGDWKEKHIRLFNVAQVTNPDKIKKWAELKLNEAEQKDIEWKKTRYGSNYEPPAPKQKEPGPEIVCSSTEPGKYLGQYLAAVSMGSKFKASPEQAAEFSEKMINALYKQLEPREKKIKDEVTGEERIEIKQPPLNKETNEPITDVFSLEKIGREANSVCRDFKRDLHIEAQKQNQLEQKQEQQQSRGGRGM